MGAKKFLYVDDDETVSEGLKRLAESVGIVMLTAHNGKEALKKVNSEDGGFSHIIVDCVLPEDNGVSLSEELKKANQRKTSKHKIYLTSGIINPSILGESIDHVESFLPKPIDRDTLNKLLDKSNKALNIKDLLTSAPDLELIADVYNGNSFDDGYDLLPLIFGLSWLNFNGSVDLVFDGGMMSLKYEENLTRITGTENNLSLGEVLVVLGYLNKSDLEKHINSEDFKNSKMRIGQHLITKNLISPHSIELAIDYQLKERLISILNKKILKFP